MSGRLIASGALSPLTRRAALQTTRQYHRLPTGGLLAHSEGAARATGRRVWFSGNAFNKAVIVRNASFARILPKLFVKLVRVPAMFGGLMIGGVAWIQYQAIQVSNSASDMYRNVKTTVTGTASDLWGGGKDVATRMQQGWENTKDQVELPEWLQKVLRLHEDIGTGGGEGGGQGFGPDPEPQQSRAGVAAAGAASAAAYGYEQSTEEDERTDEQVAKDDQMMILTKKMIEIRNILQEIGESSTLTLPSIVVIGSQSSGKSSVLEAIVGHEFLPKGSNMVTRRPIELTLVNTPGSDLEYGEFPKLGLKKVTDFTSIQRTLTELNMQVSDAECVSDDPIHLTIYSPNVPDLSLIDLPGYIQVVGHDQPPELKEKIAELCDKYIQAPNVVLAISAADVDLANSTALRASRRVDPRGERTIGVITKMDLVDPIRGAAILSDKQYPLRLGYVGVVSRVPPVTGLFKKGTGQSLMSTIARNEHAFFSSHPLEFGPEGGLAVGTTTLRKKLMHVLERTMSDSLQGTSEAIQQELDETTYEFNVKYNARPLSAEAYLAESLDAFKLSFKRLTEEFGEAQLHSILKSQLDQKVLDLLAQKYWNKPVADLHPAPPEPFKLADLSSKAVEDPEAMKYFRMQLDGATSALTRLGIGRLSTNAATESIEARITRLIEGSTFAKHPAARQAVVEAAQAILRDRYPSTKDNVEFCVKPYKFRIKLDDSEWTAARASVGEVLAAELAHCKRATAELEEKAGGRRKLREVMAFVDRARKGDVVVEGEMGSGAGGFSAELLRRGRLAVFLRDRADILSLRAAVVKSSKQCGSQEHKYRCPEVFLDAVASRLSATAVQFLDIELLSEFYHRFPRELDSRLGPRNLGPARLEAIAREDPRVAEHLDVVRRKELLELVLGKMGGLRVLEERERDGRRDEGRGEEKRKRGWGIF